MQLVQNDDNTKSIKERHEWFDSSKLLEAFYITSGEFGKYQDNYVQVKENSVKVYDQKMNLRIVYEGLNIRGCRMVHQGYLYCMSNNITKPPMITIFDGGSGVPEPYEQHEFTSSGLYVYDLFRLIEGKLEKYKLSSCISGKSSLVNKSNFGNRFSFLQNYNEMAVVPFPHVNQIECIGMGQKARYLVWREKNGFFTALDKFGKLLTWSTITGKMLYRES